MNILQGLNKSQIEATKVINGPIMVIAGAGSGKTKVLTHRIAYLIENGIDPFNILSLGPNARKDYHYNETEELFYQIEGDIIVKTQQEGKLVEYKIKENEMFLLPAKVPHSPIRSEGQ